LACEDRIEKSEKVSFFRAVGASCPQGATDWSVGQKSDMWTVQKLGVLGLMRSI